MIKQVVDSDKIPQFKAIFIDEAQDLSPLQWQLYDKLKEHCDQIYLAGDDDQAIYAWAGADVNRFIKEPAKEKNFTLFKTYIKSCARTINHTSKSYIRHQET